MGRVRSEPRQLRVRPGAQSPAGGGTVGSACRTAKRLCAASGRPARVFRDFRYCTIVQLVAARAGLSARPSRRSRAPILASSSPRSSAAASPTMRVPSTSKLIAPAERPRTQSRAVRAVRHRRLVGHHAGQSATPHVVLGHGHVLVDTLRRVGLRHSRVRRMPPSRQSAQAAEARGAGANQRALIDLRHRLGTPEQGRVRNSPTSTFSAPSAQLESQHAAKHQACS